MPDDSKDNTSNDSSATETKVAAATPSDKTSAKSTDKVVAAKPVPAPVPVVEETVTEEPTANDESATSDLSATEQEYVDHLNDMLDKFIVANRKPGSTPNDFADSAKLINQVTKFVIRMPKPYILNALLSFFKEHKDDVCNAENYMKGTSTTLSNNDERQVGYLYSMFFDLANDLIISINNSQVLQVLGKNEFVNFYNRRQQFLRQSKNNQ